MKLTGSISIASEANSLGENYISEWRRSDCKFDKLCRDAIGHFEIRATEQIYDAAMAGDAGACFYLLNGLGLSRFQLRRRSRGAA